MREGFIACDVRDLPNVQYVCNCWEIDQFVRPGKVDEIYSRHMFEHLTFAQGEQTLRAWMTVLKPGGKVHMLLPDLKYHVDEYLKNFKDRAGGTKHDNFSHAIKGFYGGQRETWESPNMTSFYDLWDVHKSGYDSLSLRDFVTEVGFVNYTRNANKPWHLDVSFYKEK